MTVEDKPTNTYYDESGDNYDGKSLDFIIMLSGLSVFQTISNFVYLLV